MVRRAEMKYKTKLQNLSTSTIQLFGAEGNARGDQQGQCINRDEKHHCLHPEMKWSGETKSRDKEIAIEIRAFFGLK